MRIRWSRCITKRDHVIERPCSYITFYYLKFTDVILYSYCCLLLVPSTYFLQLLDLSHQCSNTPVFMWFFSWQTMSNATVYSMKQMYVSFGSSNALVRVIYIKLRLPLPSTNPHCSSASFCFLLFLVLAIIWSNMLVKWRIRVTTRCSSYSISHLVSLEVLSNGSW